MDWSRFWQPRNERLAGKIGAGFICVSCGIALTFTRMTSRDAPLVTLALAYAVPLVLIALGVLLGRYPHRAPRATWVLGASTGLIVTAALNIATKDASVGSELFFLFPVFFAASQLHASAAYATAGVAAASQGATVFTLEPRGRALTDFVYFCAALACFTVLQTVAVARQDTLVEQLRRLADIDPLTSLRTRRAMGTATLAAITPARDAGTAVIFIDVDHFKKINDMNGHLVGDGVLVHLAGILQGCVRGTDTVGRLGGDELMVLMPMCAAEQALARAEDIVRTVRQNPYQGPGGADIPLSVSVGVAHVPGGFHGEPAQVYALADQALYDAKRAGRGRVGAGVRTPASA